MVQEPSANEIRVLRESSSILEKREIIRRFSKMKTETVLFPILNSLYSGERELIEEAAKAFVRLLPISENIIQSEITNENRFIRWAIILTIQKIDDSSYSSRIIPAIGIGYEPVVKLICETLYHWFPNKFTSSFLSDIINGLSLLEKEPITYYSIRQLGILAFDSTETLSALKTLEYLHSVYSIVPLLKVQQHGDYRIRDEGLRIFNGFSKKEIYTSCIKFLNSGTLALKYDFTLAANNYPARLYAIIGLGYVGLDYKNVKQLLLDFLFHGSNLEKFFMIKSLSHLSSFQYKKFTESTEIKQKIQDFLQKLSGHEKLETIQILGRFKESWIISILFTFLKDENPEVRLSVLEAISVTPTDAILEKIAFLLIDENRHIRRATVRLFEELEPDNYLMKSSEGNIIDKLPKKLKEKILAKLMKGLDGTDKKYQSFAAFWLGTLDYKPAIDKLIENLNNFDLDIQISTINALGIIGSTKAIKYLIPLLNDTQNALVQRKAIETIGNLGNEGEGVKTLIHLLYPKGKPPHAFLENYIQSYGGRIIPMVYKEIELEKDPERQEKLQTFLTRLNKKYRISTEKSFDIIL